MKLEELFENDEIIFLTYLKVITQSFITATLDVLEKIDDECENIKFSNKLYTIFIEVAQNIMHYRCRERGFKAFIAVGENSEFQYIFTENLVKEENKHKIEKLFKEFLHLDKSGIKKLYKEKRKSGEGKHIKGGGIGFLEIAKIAEKIEYSFEHFEDKYIFSLKIFLPKK